MPRVLILILTRDVFQELINIIEEITQWVNSPNADTMPRIFFLGGVAGYRKSAIAHTVAWQFNMLGQLGLSYCFNCTDQANCHPASLLSTIATQVGGKLPGSHEYENCPQINMIQEPPILRTPHHQLRVAQWLVRGDHRHHLELWQVVLSGLLGQWIHVGVHLLPQLETPSLLWYRKIYI